MQIPKKYTYQNRIEWRLDGLLHRTDGPSVIYPSGTMEWWQNGKRHRDIGPAVVYSNGREE